MVNVVRKQVLIRRKSNITCIMIITVILGTDLRFGNFCTHAHTKNPVNSTKNNPQTCTSKMCHVMTVIFLVSYYPKSLNFGQKFNFKKTYFLDIFKFSRQKGIFSDFRGFTGFPVNSQHLS